MITKNPKTPDTGCIP